MDTQPLPDGVRVTGSPMNYHVKIGRKALPPEDAKATLITCADIYGQPEAREFVDEAREDWWYNLNANLECDVLEELLVTDDVVVRIYPHYITVVEIRGFNLQRLADIVTRCYWLAQWVWVGVADYDNSSGTIRVVGRAG